MGNKYKVNGINFIEHDNDLFVEINQCGVDCFYPLKPTKTNKKPKFLLMDLDGTTVKSEEFWMYLIECTVKEMLNDDSFRLQSEDQPFVSGFTTVEHLTYCKNKFKFKQDINTALAAYHRIARYELNEIMEGRGNINAFKPREGLKEFLSDIHKAGIKIGLATSGLDYKAIPEIVSTFKILNMGEPLNYYDAIITGGKQKNKGEYGNIGELAAKPHPWVYSELALGLNITDKADAVVLEDSSAGVISGRLAGFNVVGLKDGNIYASNLDDQCIEMVDNFDDVRKFLGI